MTSSQIAVVETYMEKNKIGVLRPIRKSGVWCSVARREKMINGIPFYKIENCKERLNP